MSTYYYIAIIVLVVRLIIAREICIRIIIFFILMTLNFRNLNKCFMIYIYIAVSIREQIILTDTRVS